MGKMEVKIQIALGVQWGEIGLGKVSNKDYEATKEIMADSGARPESLWAERNAQPVLWAKLHPYASPSTHQTWRMVVSSWPITLSTAPAPCTCACSFGFGAGRLACLARLPFGQPWTHRSARLTRPWGLAAHLLGQQVFGQARTSPKLGQKAVLVPEHNWLDQNKFGLGQNYSRLGQMPSILGKKLVHVS